MTATDPTSLARLRELLLDATAAPAELARRLAEARRAATGESALAAELLSRELLWLEQQAATAAVPALGEELHATRSEWLRWRLQGLLAASEADAAVLFDLAEIEGLAECEGDGALAAACRDAIVRRAPAVATSARLQQETMERVAALAALPDEVALQRHVHLLRATGRAMAAVAALDGGQACRAPARRMARLADDRELALRLERRLGRRGVAVLETTNFVLLLVVLVTLVVESVADLTVGQLFVLHAIDAAACSFFVLDFLVEFALHPRRGSWFLRNAATDLLPAIPAVLWLFPSVALPGIADEAVVLRWVRLMRVTWAARYVQAMRPLLRSARLLVFLVRGMDGLAARFARLLNRDFVFVPAAGEIDRPVAEEVRRDLMFSVLRREHDLIGLLPATERADVVLERLGQARAALRSVPARAVDRAFELMSRDVPIDEAIELLWTLRPQDLGRWLRPADIGALDRVVRVLSAPPVRWLPIISRFAVAGGATGPEDRIVLFARRIAEWLESWHSRLLFYADLHGIVTGPQILDRIATALVKATQRPTVRLLLIGGILALLEKERFSEPVLILGAICLGLFSLGLWLKRVAGEASETYRLTSEAHFLSQIELVKRRYEAVDLAFLARRVFGDGSPPLVALRAQLAGTRAGVPSRQDGLDEGLCLEANRVALLYLHFLDGAPLHVSDVKTTEQLLANQSIDNLRTEFLGHGRKEQKMLRKLRLDDGTIFRGPFLWFSFITESIAVEAAKRIAGYNRCCLPLGEVARASEEERERMQQWLNWRRDPRAGRTIGGKAGLLVGDRFATTEFTALDFVGADPERDRHLAATFGEEVLEVLRADRRTMVREIFGTRPVHHLPKHERSFNPLRFYRRRLSRGRVLLAPLLLAWRFVRSLGWMVARTRQIVREVFDPELAMRRREAGVAPFAVALRKIHRMKAPGLLEAIRLRLHLDPAYAGAPAGWSSGAPFVSPAPLEHDLEFLQLREREAAQLRDRAAEIRRHVAALHAALQWLPELSATRQGEDRQAQELAVTVAWITDKDRLRTLLLAERWRVEWLPRLADEPLRGGIAASLWRGITGLFRVHPVDQWLQRHGRELPRALRRSLMRAYASDWQGARAVIDAWRVLPAGASPAATAIAILRAMAKRGTAVRRDLLSLRAVQSLAVLDVRNYRDLVFQLGDYAADGEDPALGSALPQVERGLVQAHEPS